MIFTHIFALGNNPVVVSPGSALLDEELTPGSKRGILCEKG